MARRWAIATAIALAVPVLCFAALVAARSSLDSQWLEALYGPNGVITDDARAAYSLSALCADPAFTADPDNAGACVDMRAILGLQAVTGVVIGLTVLLILGSLGLVAVTRGNRDRMARLYRPGLVVFLLGISVLLLLQGLLVIGAAYEVPAVLFGEVLPILLLGMGIAVLAGVVGMFRSLRTMTRAPRVWIPGVALDAAGNAALFEEVRSIASAAGAEAPEVIMAGIDPSFFVVDSEVDGFDGPHRGRVLFLSLPYCRLLSRAELRAIVGHEVGHFRGRDTQYTKAFAPVYRASREGLASLYAASARWSGIPNIPAIKLLEAFILSFAASEQAISRERELAADRVGAEVSTREALASSLVTLSRTSDAWRAGFGSAFEAVRAGAAMPDLSTEITQRARALIAAGVAPDRRIPHPFDSHPTIEVRLKALGLDEQATASPSTPATPEDAAVDLFGDAAELERSLNMRYEQDMRAQAARIAAAPLPVHH